jgi:hypothetical protein
VSRCWGGNYYPDLLTSLYFGHRLPGKEAAMARPEIASRLSRDGTQAIEGERSHDDFAGTTRCVATFNAILAPASEAGVWRRCCSRPELSRRNQDVRPGSESDGLGWVGTSPRWCPQDRDGHCESRHELPGVDRNEARDRAGADGRLDYEQCRGDKLKGCRCG